MHDSIRKALIRKGVPQKVVEGNDMYRGATTVIGVRGKFTRRITINSGVKQGFHLSPFLFNVIMDELLERIEQKKFGAKIGNICVSVMEFVDDLVLMAEDPGDKSVLLNDCEKLFDKKG